MKNKIRNQDKLRAVFSYQCVQCFVNENSDENQKKYRAYIRNIPSMILNNGLGSTITFIFSKNKEDVYNRLGADIYNWLNKEQNSYLINLDKKEKLEEKLQELTTKIICLNSSEYRAVTNELLSLFSWLKRFADGMIEGDEEDGKKEEK
jgi:CRISPR-associated protein Cmr5